MSKRSAGIRKDFSELRVRLIYAGCSCLLTGTRRKNVGALEAWKTCISKLVKYDKCMFNVPVIVNEIGDIPITCPQFNILFPV